MTDPKLGLPLLNGGKLASLPVRELGEVRVILLDGYTYVYDFAAAAELPFCFRRRELTKLFSDNWHTQHERRSVDGWAEKRHVSAKGVPERNNWLRLVGTGIMLVPSTILSTEAQVQAFTQSCQHQNYGIVLASPSQMEILLEDNP